MRFICHSDIMKLVKSIVFIALLVVVWYWLYLYFSPKTPDNSLIAQVQTWAMVDSGSVNVEDIDRTFILNSWQRIWWHWRKVGWEHFWLVDAISWSILTSWSEVIGGWIDIDLRTIQVEWLTWTLNDQLIVHLKESFFQVQDYPIASLQIVWTTWFVQSEENSTWFDASSTQTWMIVNLTMHWVTNQIIVPLIIDFTWQNLVLDSVFYVDRTQWWIVEAEWVVDKYFWISGKLMFSLE